MAVVVSQIVVLTLGVAVLVLSMWGFVVPDKLMKFVTSTMDQPSGIYIAVAVRVVLGAALIGVAPASQFPVTFQVLGAITLLAAASLAVAGRERVGRFLEWWVKQFSATGNRLWLLLGMAFGALLVYGTVG